MTRTAPPFRKSRSASDVCDSLPVADVPTQIEAWLLAGDINRHSARTLQTRRERMASFVWFLRYREYETCGLTEVRAFFHYLNHGHKEPGGRWGNPRCTKPVTSGRVKSYHSTLRTFFRWLVAEMVLDVSPMERVPAPVDRPDQVTPFTEDQINALLKAAKRGNACPRRDEAIVLLLLDTGLRASELCGLNSGDVDLKECRLRVRDGKGGKSRLVYFSEATRKALYLFLKEEGYAADDPLFQAQHGPSSGERLTRYGLHQLIGRLAETAKITGVRCSPHTFRHTYAVMMLRNGANVFTVKESLGHTTLAMTNRYVAIANCDLAEAGRRYLPVSRLKK